MGCAYISDRASLACSSGHYAPTSSVAPRRAATEAFQIAYRIGEGEAAWHRAALKPAILSPARMRLVGETGKNGRCARDGRDRRSAGQMLSGFQSPCRAGCAMPGTSLEYPSETNNRETGEHGQKTPRRVLGVGLPVGVSLAATSERMGVTGRRDGQRPFPARELALPRRRNGTLIRARGTLHPGVVDGQNRAALQARIAVTDRRDDQRNGGRGCQCLQRHLLAERTGREPGAQPTVTVGRDRHLIKHRAPSSLPVMATGLPGGRSGPSVCPPTSLLDLSGVALRHPRFFRERAQVWVI